MNINATGNAGTSARVATFRALDQMVAATNPALSHYARKTMLIGILRFLVEKADLNASRTTYEAVASAIGMHHRTQAFFALLGEISTDCVNAGGAAITAIVCRAGKYGAHVPGPAFYGLLEQLRGLNLRDASGDYDTDKCRAAWENELNLLGITP